MRMWRGRDRWAVAEDVLGALKPRSEPVHGRLEHMFGSVGGASDGTDFRLVYAADPSDDHTSSFVRTRATTAVVNSLVPAWPPRSGVFVPDAIVSNTAS